MSEACTQHHKACPVPQNKLFDESNKPKYVFNLNIFIASVNKFIIHCIPHNPRYKTRLTIWQYLDV
jgi:hypothetical protein